MSVLKKIVTDQTFIAHGLGLLGVVGTALAGISPVFGAIIAGLTAVFHIAQTFGNGKAVPPGYTFPGEPAPDRSSATSADGAGFGAPHVDAPAPPMPLMNASGTTKVEP